MVPMGFSFKEMALDLKILMVFVERIKVLRKQSLCLKTRTNELKTY